MLSRRLKVIAASPTMVRYLTLGCQHLHQAGGSYSSDKETHFGYETVSEKEKARKVKSVFENVAQTYDTMNDVMSVGVHRIWKDIFVSRLGPGDHAKVIDVAGGTGDIAFRMLKYTKVKPDRAVTRPQPPPQEVNPIRSVLVCDINPKMLDVGKARSKTILNSSQRERIDWLEGDAENLCSIPDNSFDAYTIAFGIRNCVHVDQILAEAYRVLRPGGRFMCLEFSHVQNEALKWAYDQYSFQVIPVMGQVIAGDWDSYQYLVESIRKFPNQEQFKDMIEEAGFRFVRFEDLSFGVAAIHSGFKI